MHKRTFFLLPIVAVMSLAACDDDQPPTQIVMQVTVPTTPIVVVVTPTDADGATEEAVVTETAAPTDEITPTLTASPATNAAAPFAASATPPATQTVPPSATARPDIFPTNVTAQVPVAEQVFEHGHMFWIRHNRQIWVMVARDDDPNSGDWYCYNDTFEEGEVETDPSLVPPQNLYQPRRGFGKLWRSHSELKEALGWGTTPEFELTSQYTYIAGGYVQGNQYFPGPGEHRLTTSANDVVSFYEGDIRGDCQGGTWRMAPAS